MAARMQSEAVKQNRYGPYMSDAETQQVFLRRVKRQLEVTWDELATLAGISPMALKTYRMPSSSKDFRPMPELARRSLSHLMSERERTNR